jgi:hypothetical protein
MTNEVRRYSLFRNDGHGIDSIRRDKNGNICLSYEVEKLEAERDELQKELYIIKTHNAGLKEQNRICCKENEKLMEELQKNYQIYQRELEKFMNDKNRSKSK